MARAAAKAKRASTPLSSPPASPPPAASVYTFREGSYYTDDQSDGSYTDGPGPPKASKRKAQVASDETSTHDLHAQYCRLHDDPLATHCNAMTQARKKCSRKAKEFTMNFWEGETDRPILPVCSLHALSYLAKKAGRCQAVEDCGYTCNRLAAFVLPYHLCTKHEAGTGTLPCGIMGLPTELHLMILRYVLPSEVPFMIGHYSPEIPRHCMAVMRVNRALYQATSLVLYTETKFKAYIDPSTIRFLGRYWFTDRDNNDKYTDIEQALCQLAARKVRNLHVELRFGYGQTKFKGIGSHGISAEDYELYQLRDTVRDFVGLLEPTEGSRSEPIANVLALKQLHVRPAPQAQANWKTDEAVSAIFFVLEPFVALSPAEEPRVLPCAKPSTSWRHHDIANTIKRIHKDETYRRLHKDWVRSMNGKSGASSMPQRQEGTDISITNEYHKIQSLWRLIQKSKCGDIQTAFQGMERVMHICRVVDMNIGNDDLERMQQIKEAIVRRWVNAVRQHQRSLAAIASRIEGIYDPKGAYPDAFEFEPEDLIEGGAPASHAWSEIELDTIPKLMEAGVTFTEDDLRVYIHKDGKDFVRLKTPAVIRQLRSVKRESKRESSISTSSD
jgi:hypothetical protein